MEIAIYLPDDIAHVLPWQDISRHLLDYSLYFLLWVAAHH
jgi:hypothetical protein